MLELFNIEKLIKQLKKIAPIIGIIILVYLIANVGTDKIITAFLKISPIYIIIAASITIPRILITNYQWQLILKKQKIHINNIKSLKMLLIGYFYALLTPGNSGSFVKTLYIKDETNEPLGKLFINCVIHSVVIMLPTYCMMLIGAFLISEKVPELLPFALIVILGNIAIYAYFIKKERGEKTLNLLIKLFIPKKLKKYFTGFVDTFYNDFPPIRSLILPFLLGVICSIMFYSQFYVIGLSLDIKVPYLTFIMIYPIAIVISSLPITFNGFGTREAASVFLFSFFGVPWENAIVLSLAGYLIVNLPVSLSGFLVSVAEAKPSESFSSYLGLLERKKSLKQLK
jgi:uncharacterized protein (TIRG00374 family)